MLKAVIVEDDPISQTALKELLESTNDSIKVEGIFSDVASAIQGMKELSPDLLFLDMELPDGKGFNVLRAMNEIDFEVVITTNHDTFMLQAIQHSALDYLMKPVTKNSLFEALDRFHQRRSKQSKKPIIPTQRNKLVISDQEGLTLVEIADILRFESDGAYSHLYLSDGTELMASKNIGYFEQQLKDHEFFRVHHKHLVNLNKVRTLSKRDGGYLVLSDHMRIPISRRKKDEVFSAFGY